MLAKYWKKIGLIIVIVACVFNVMIKLINKLSLDQEMLSSAKYIYDENQKEEENKKYEQKNNKQDNNKYDRNNNEQ